MAKYKVFVGHEVGIYAKVFADYNSALRYALANGGRVYYIPTKRLVANCDKG